MKTKTELLKLLIYGTVVLSMSLGFISCGKNETQVTPAYFKAGESINDTTTCWSLKGTMLTGKTYRIERDIMANTSDTMVVQPGVKLYFAATPAGQNAISMVVRGSLLSL